MDLFEDQYKDNKLQDAPLARRMRPVSLTEFVGQRELLGDDSPLRRAIEADQLHSLILYGPPGTGKTTLAEIIARRTEAEFVRLNAVTAGVKDLRREIKRARERKKFSQQQTVLFLDEVHRFNRSQQDALLPAVEDGLLTLIGATTENPYHEVNSPLLSRSRVFSLKPLKGEEIGEIIDRALSDEERGLGELQVELKGEARDYLIRMADGDARSALNALEMAVLTAPLSSAGRRIIDLEQIEKSLQRKAVRYDRTGDNHYDITSALIKSMRGSDPDATLYWLARMIDAGEDPRFIARRLIVHAAEDVGNANPHALMVATSAARAVEFVGLPEARIPLAQAALFIATAPKSNAVYRGIDDALQAVKKSSGGQVPPHLRDTSYRGAEKLGHGKGYLYPHDYPGGYVEQDYLPDGLQGEVFYRPSGEGYEAKIMKQMREMKKRAEKKER